MAKVYKDLREFLKTLEDEGQLVRIKEEVDPEPNIAAAGRAASSIKNGPAVFFEKIKGYKYSVVTNVHGSWANSVMSMPSDLYTRFSWFPCRMQSILPLMGANSFTHILSCSIGCRFAP